VKELPNLASALFKGTSQERDKKLRLLVNAYVDASKRFSQILYGRRTRQLLVKHSRIVKGQEDRSQID
jgi:hypothetical protein